MLARNWLWVVVFGAMLLLAVVSEARAHENWVTLHNGNDAGAVINGHSTLLACDGTNNGHSFGLQGETASGNRSTVWDSGSGSQCQSFNPDSRGDFVRHRWVCHGQVGPWRSS